MSSLLMDHHMVINGYDEQKFTEIQHNTWRILFNRQVNILENRAVDEMMEGMKKLAICNSEIPRFSDLNKILEQETNFSIIPVKGFIPPDLFFRFLSKRKFPSTCFIRKANQLDYLEEPDIFHDVFGHLPLLVHPIFADFMELFGFKGLEAIECGMLKFAAALYWFTVEFGLITTSNGLRIYGAGIASSKGESIYALDSDIPARIKFNPVNAMLTKYHIDTFQQKYFIIQSFTELFKTLEKLSWNELATQQVF